MPLNHPGKAYKPGSISEHCVQCDQQLAETGQSTTPSKNSCKPFNHKVCDRYFTAACNMILQQDGTEHEHVSHLVGF